MAVVGEDGDGGEDGYSRLHSDDAGDVVDDDGPPRAILGGGEVVGCLDGSAMATEL